MPLGSMATAPYPRPRAEPGTSPREQEIRRKNVPSRMDDRSTPHQFHRKRQRQERRHRLSSHGGKVAQSTRQASMPDRFGRMPLAPEMHRFQRKVCCDKHFMPERRTKDCAIIANTCDYRRKWRSHGIAPPPRRLASSPDCSKRFATTI